MNERHLEKSLQSSFKVSQPLVMLMSGFDQSERVSPSRMAALARHVAKGGLSNYLIGGVVGELHDTDPEEREAMLVAVRDALNDSPQTRIFVGVPAGAGAAGAADQANRYMELGAKGVMLFHGQHSAAESELFDACAALNAGAYPFLIDYDGKSIEATQIAGCASLGSLVGIKYGAANYTGWRRMRDVLPPDVPLIFGGGDDLAPNFDGAATFTSTTANVVPSLIRDLALKLERSISRSNGAVPVEFGLERWAALRSSRPGYAAAVIKQALDARGIPVGSVRSPEGKFQEDDNGELLSVVQELVNRERSLNSDHVTRGVTA